MKQVIRIALQQGARSHVLEVLEALEATMNCSRV